MSGQLKVISRIILITIKCIEKYKIRRYETLSMTMKMTIVMIISLLSIVLMLSLSLATFQVMPQK